MFFKKIFQEYHQSVKQIGSKSGLTFWADNSIKIWRKLPISNPKPDLRNINAHTKFDENPLMFVQVII